MKTKIRYYFDLSAFFDSLSSKKQREKYIKLRKEFNEQKKPLTREMRRSQNFYYVYIFYIIFSPFLLWIIFSFLNEQVLKDLYLFFSFAQPFYDFIFMEIEAYYARDAAIILDPKHNGQFLEIYKEHTSLFKSLLMVNFFLICFILPILFLAYHLYCIKHSNLYSPQIDEEANLAKGIFCLVCTIFMFFWAYRWGMPYVLPETYGGKTPSFGSFTHHFIRCLILCFFNLSVQVILNGIVRYSCIEVKYFLKRSKNAE